MSRAPSIASCMVETVPSFDVGLFVGSGVFGSSGTPTPTVFDRSCLSVTVIYCFAISFMSFVSFCSYIIFANGSNPLAFAIVALVFFFCLYGLYMSSTSARVLASATALVICSVNFPCSSIFFTTSCFLCSKFLK